MAKRVHLLVAGLLVATAPVSATTLFTDNFNATTSSAYDLAKTADALATFQYNYSALGIPAPTGQTDTIGLRLDANQSSGTVSGITVSPKGVTLTDAASGYRVSFDMWLNANGPFPGGGAGSTQFLTGGVGWDRTTPNVNLTSGKGAWFAVSGEGGAARDVRAYVDATELDGATAAGSTFFDPDGFKDNSSTYYSDPVKGFGTPVIPAAQVAAFPQQTGDVAAGSAGFQWRKFVIEVKDNTATWSISANDGSLLPIARIDQTGPAAPMTGAISIGYMDPFTSVSDNLPLTAGIIDNLKIETLSLPGDVNNDGLVNGQDINPFVFALLNGDAAFAVQYPTGSFANADVNADTLVNGQDINPFVAKLLGTGIEPAQLAPLAAVPEPGSLALVALAAAGLGQRRRARSSPEAGI